MLGKGSRIAVGVSTLLLLSARVAFAQPVPSGEAPVVVPVPPPVPAPPRVPSPATPASVPQSTPAAVSPSSASPAPSPSRPPTLEVASLRLLREKGFITQAEYDSAVRDLAESTGQRAGDQGTVVLGKWATTLYGFVETDNIYDSTRSFSDGPGGALVARADTQAGENPRYTVSVRNSRFGVRLKAPELVSEVRASGVLEMDFMGTQTIGTGTGQVSEGAYWTSPTVRVRHAYLRIENPVVDFLVGQYWQLFGWRHAYRVATVSISGVPGEVYARSPQVRLSKDVHIQNTTLGIAVAASRPVQRDAATPDLQGGVRIALDSWTGVQTAGATGTDISPLSVGVSGLLRHVAVDEWSATPKVTKDLGMSAFAFNVFLPVIPGSKDHKDNSLSLIGEYATGYGIADFYTGLTGGVGFPALPNPTMAKPAPTYTPDIDPGIVTFDSGGGLHGVEWSSLLVGAQYYLPFTDGAVFLSGNYSHTGSSDAGKYSPPSTTLDVEDWFDVNLFVDPTPALRIGLQYANYNDLYFDGSHAINHRGDLAGYFIF
jgi:hypothetical protein